MKNRAFYSIRWRFVIVNILLVVTCFSFAFAAASSLVNNYLLNQRLQKQLKDAGSLGVQVSSYLAQSDAAEMYNTGTRSYNDGMGRILVLNDAGIVQMDTFSEYNGYLLSFSEIQDVLYGGEATSYGFHEIEDSGNKFWALYCTTSIIHDGRLIGVLLCSTSIQDLVDASVSLQSSMFVIFLLGIGAIVVASIVLTRYITRPVQQLTQVALRISAGDLESRAKISGRNEIAELGRTFNMMCDRLENIDQQRNEFVSDASHELKTPLASMKILVESLLYQDNVPEEVYKDFLSDINQEIDRLTHLITDLLLLSKMDTDSAVLNLTKTSLNELLEECVDSLQPIAKKKGIRIELTTPSQIELEADPLKLRQAVNNLIENAVKYSHERGFVKVSAGRQGADAFVRVEDNGIGMPRADLPHIFERFYRVDKARARETGGTGLGLHIVRRVALMHGGRVEVESAEEKGSTFVLFLPLNPSTSKKD